jgi:hypothetical protein
MVSSGIRISILIVFLCMSISVFPQTGGGITGSWKCEIKGKHIEMEIYQAIDSAYYGKIINDNSIPSTNGTIILKKLKYDKTSQTFKGTMRPHDADVELDATVTVIDKDRLKIIAKKLFMSRTVYLTRIK